MVTLIVLSVIEALDVALATWASATVVAGLEHLDLFVAHKAKDQGWDLGYYGQVGSKSEDQDVEASQSVVASLPEIVPWIREIKCIKDRSEGQWESKDDVGEPELAPKLVEEFWEVQSQATEHDDAHDEEDHCKDGETGDYRVGEWGTGFFQPGSLLVISFTPKRIKLLQVS